MADQATNQAAPQVQSAVDPANQNAQTSTKVNQQTGTPTPQQPLSTSMGGKVDPKAAQQADAQKQAAARKLKLKVDGRDEELPEDEVVKWAQMGRAAQKRFQEASQMRKQAEDFVKLLKENPREVLSNPAIGVDLRKFAEDYLAEQLKLETLSPDQKRIKELEDKLRSEETSKKQQEEQRQQEEFKRLTQQYQQEFETKIMDAITSSGLPRTPYIVQRMVNYMTQALGHGMDIEPRDVVELVRSDYKTDTQSLYGQLDGETLLQVLGDSVANKIRKADLARIKKLQNQPLTPQVPGQDSEPSPIETGKPSAKATAADNKKFMNIHEWRAEMEKKRTR